MPTWISAEVARFLRRSRRALLRLQPRRRLQGASSRACLCSPSTCLLCWIWAWGNLCCGSWNQQKQARSSVARRTSLLLFEMIWKKLFITILVFCLQLRCYIMCHCFKWQQYIHFWIFYQINITPTIHFLFSMGRLWKFDGDLECGEICSAAFYAVWSVLADFSWQTTCSSWKLGQCAFAT